jgi:uncharacterized protein (DUF2237 family)
VQRAADDRLLSRRLLQHQRRRPRQPHRLRRATADFLEFSQGAGNDLSTPRPEFGFPGLKPGDRWCLCAARWREALQAGKAPRSSSTATNEACLLIVGLDDLKRHAIDLN